MLSDFALWAVIVAGLDELERKGICADAYTLREFMVSANIKPLPSIKRIARLLKTIMKE